MTESKGFVTEIARTHLGVSLVCLAATSALVVYDYLRGERKDLCGSLMMAAGLSMAYPIVVPCAAVIAVSDWRNNTRTTCTASFKTCVTSNKT
jgi:hypothetical protein